MYKLSLKGKFAAFGAVAISVSLMTSAGSYYVTNALQSAFHEYENGMQAAQHEARADNFHDAIRGDVYVALHAARAGDTEGLAAVKKQLSEHIETMQKELHSNEELRLSPEGRQALAAVNAQLVPYFKTAQEIIGLAATDKAAAEARLPEILRHFSTLEKSMGTTSDLLEKMASDGMVASQKAAKSGSAVLATVAAVAVAIQLLLCYVLARSILRELGGEPAYASEIVGKIARGDLSVEVTTRTGDTSSLLGAMSQMQKDLRARVLQIRDSAGAISSASGEIASGNADLSQRTEEQASSLEETASSMEELTSAVRQNAENAKQANQLADSASAVAVKGGEVVSHVVETMSSINEASRKIADIISVIDGIAFQTNILALNAAVEAARAGEQGRGFAVVASEVRTLAQRSAAAAKEIKALIIDSVHKVEDGSRLVADAGSTMDEVVTSVKRVTEIMREISAASQEQSSGIEQVNQAVSQMDRVTQQNAALVEEAAAAAESMQQQAETLKRAVSVFTVGAVGRQVSLVSRNAAVGGPATHVSSEATSADLEDEDRRAA